MSLLENAVSLLRQRSSAARKSSPPPLPPTPVCELQWPAFPSPQIRGCVDGIAGDEIRGWIIDLSDPHRYIKLCLIAEGKFVEKTSTCIFRKDLEQLFNTKGLHGFSFRIPPELQTKAEIDIEIKLEDGRQLCAPTILRNPAPGPAIASAPRKPCLLVMHIPKTGVTAVRSALRCDWLTDRQLWLYADAPGFPPEHLLYLTGGQLRRAECIFGHFPFGLHHSLPQPSRYATLLRDPLQRCISHYFHERRKSNDPNAPARCLSLDDLLRSDSEVAFDNLMVRMLSGRVDLPFGEVTRDVLREAIERIHQWFCYVGFQQRTSEAVGSLAQYLNLQPNPLHRENLGSYEPQASSSPFVLQKLREYNEFDLEVCEYVEKTFWSTGAQGWVRRPGL